MNQNNTINLEGEVSKIIYINIKKKLGDFLLDIELTSVNDVLALLGPSGCGKSMTLKCIAGIETPDEGQIILKGRTLFDSDKKINLSPQERKVGLLFQNYALFPNMTLKENIIFGIRDKNNDSLNRVNQMIEDFSLKGLENNYPHQLSGGQQQRAALARMLINDPEILMLDEPFSALDEHLKWNMEKELVKITKTFNGPIIYVSHNKDEVYRICDKVAVMNDGRIEEQNEKFKIFNHPETIYGAILIGYKNISEVEVKNKLLYAKDWNISFPIDKLSANHKISDIRYIGVKENNLYESFEEDKESIKFTIVNIIEELSNTLLVLDFNKSSSIYMEIPICHNDRYKVGDSLYVKIPYDNLMLFT